MAERPRILIVRLGAMGDVIHALPVAQALRQALPDCEIGWVIERRWVPLICAEQAERAGPLMPERPLVHRFHEVDTRRWRKAIARRETWRELSGVIRKLRSVGYELAIDVQGAIKSAVLAALSQAPEVWGFEHPREKIATIFYSRAHEASAAHVVDQNLELAAAILSSRSRDVSSFGGAQFVFPVDLRSEEWAQKFLDEIGSDRFAIINPGAGWGAKCWPGSSYAEVARWLVGNGVTPLINFGPGEESLARGVQQLAPGSQLLQATLAQLIALTRRAALFVGGDTGPMHLAAALSVPVVALFGPTDPARNGPYAPAACGAVLRSSQSVTSYSHVSGADSGLLSITAGGVIAAVERILKSES